MDDIIVVEGTHDVIKIHEAYPNANCVITNGSEISVDTINYIKELSKSHNIIVFTDPDYPGERIRSKIEEIVPNCKHAFIRKKDAHSSNNKKLGVEHATKEVIIECLENVYENNTSNETITNLDLFDLGLTGKKDSALLRDKISDKLNIGRPNNKTFLKRLNLIGITRKNLEEIICQIK
jgi:ribonuclease M5